LIPTVGCDIDHALGTGLKPGAGVWGRVAPCVVSDNGTKLGG